MWNRAESPKNEGARPVHAPAPAIAGVPIEGQRMGAWFGKSVVFKGHLTSSEDMTISGRVEGTIEVRDHSLTIGPGADIRADIVAKTVTVLGAVTGTITASDKIEIGDTGSVEGDVNSPRLAMVDGAVVHGRIDSLTGHAEKRGVRPLLAAAV